MKTKFQFHIVRLKGAEAQDSHDERGKFQFHIVRLKAYALRDTLFFTNISIPYSSIKRADTWRTRGGWHKFQFHIVRLKDSGY